MKLFDLEVMYGEHDSRLFTDLTAEAMMTYFDQQNWHRMLQETDFENNHPPLFFLKNSQDQSHFNFNPNIMPQTGRIFFQLDSSIEVTMIKKVFFGLLNKQSTEEVAMNDLTKYQMREYLSSFLNKDIDSIKQQFIRSIENRD